MLNFLNCGQSGEGIRRRCPTLFTKSNEYRFYKTAIGSTRLGLRLSLKGRVLFGAQVIRTDEEEFS